MRAWSTHSWACQAVAAGADGLLVEVHPNPPEAWCDADQALTPPEFVALMAKLEAVALAVGRTLDGRPKMAERMRETAV